MKVSQLVKLLKNVSVENVNEIEKLISNRKVVTQQDLKELKKSLRGEHVYIDEDDMGQATWYYIWKKTNVKGPHDWTRLNIADQFYWNDGEYDAEGNHSLYDEYGMAL